MKLKKPYTMTVFDFKHLIWPHIENLPDNAEIYFGNGDLSFHRPKFRGEILTIEFNQLYTITSDPEQD